MIRRAAPLRIPGLGRIPDLLDDLRRVRAGVATLWRSSRSDACQESGIGILGASSPSVNVGGENRYSVGITNARPVARTLVLVLELAPAAIGPSSRDRATVAKWLTVPARTAVLVEVICDWERSASVIADGRSVRCERAVPGEGSALRGRCTVAALLLDLHGQPLDRVTIEQEAAP